MKKFMAWILALICVLGLAACANAEPEIIRKTYTGEITSIDLDNEILTVLDEEAKPQEGKCTETSNYIL